MRRLGPTAKIVPKSYVVMSALHLVGKSAVQMKLPASSPNVGTLSLTERPSEMANTNAIFVKVKDFKPLSHYSQTRIGCHRGPFRRQNGRVNIQCHALRSLVDDSETPNGKWLSAWLAEIKVSK
jgi:hypothetical protein